MKNPEEKNPCKHQEMEGGQDGGSTDYVEEDAWSAEG